MSPRSRRIDKSTSAPSLYRLLENNADGIIVLNKKGKVMYANPVAQELINRTEEELEGHDFGLPVAEEGTPVEIDILAGDGTPHTVQMRVTNFGWENEEAQILSLRDVTEYKNLTAALQELNQKLEEKVEQRTEEIKKRADKEYAIRRIIQAAHSSLQLDNIFQEVVDETGQLLNVDRCFICRYDDQRHLLLPPSREYRASEDISSMLDIVPTLSTQADRKLYDSWYRGGVPIRFDPHTKGLSKETKASLEKHQVKSGLACVITYRHKLLAVLLIQQVHEKREWTQYEKDIIHEVANQAALAIIQSKTAQNLKAARKEAEKANRKKSEILRFVSHEIKNPLYVISGAIEIILRRAGKNDPNLALYNRIYKASDAILKLVQDLLDIERIKRGELELDIEQFKPKEICNQAHEWAQILAKDKGIAIAYHYDDEIETVTADPDRLQQILINLLSNAIKYSFEDQKVLFRVSYSKDKSHVEFMVKDRGVGIPKSQIKELFKEFYRIEDTKALSHGHGLGLAVCKKLAEVQNGEIKVTSQERIGSTFTLILPAG